MADQEKQRLYENLDDALFAVAMHDYVEEEGRRLLEEDERLKDDPAFDVPASLHQRALETIDREFARVARERRTARLKPFFRRAALVAVIIAALGTITAVSVEAIRTRFFNTVIRQQETHSSVSVEESADPAGLDGVPMPTWLPEGYELVEMVSPGTRQVILKYANPDGCELQLVWEKSIQSSTNIDSEDTAIYKELSINGNDAILTFKEDWLLFWIDYPASCSYQIFGGSGLTEEEIIKIAEHVQ